MRTVSFVERVEFEYNGNLFSKAIAVGDVDNDKAYKLYFPSIIAHNVTFHNWFKSNRLFLWNSPPTIYLESFKHDDIHNFCIFLVCLYMS